MMFGLICQQLILIGRVSCESGLDECVQNDPNVRLVSACRYLDFLSLVVLLRRVQSYNEIRTV